MIADQSSGSQLTHPRPPQPQWAGLQHDFSLIWPKYDMQLCNRLNFKQARLSEARHHLHKLHATRCLTDLLNAAAIADHPACGAPPLICFIVRYLLVDRNMHPRYSLLHCVAYTNSRTACNRFGILYGVPRESKWNGQNYALRSQWAFCVHVAAIWTSYVSGPAYKYRILFFSGFLVWR